MVSLLLILRSRHGICCFKVTPDKLEKSRVSEPCNGNDYEKVHYEKPRSQGIVKTTGFRHSIWGGKEHAWKEKTQVRDNIQTLSNLYEISQFFQ